MCARLFACPLCSQPGFLTLDALRAGLVSVSTRPLACPVCNEVLLGIDKLTIHLFSHAIAPASNEPWSVVAGNEAGKDAPEGIYIPIDEIGAFASAAQELAAPAAGQLIFLQSVTNQQPASIISANLVAGESMEQSGEQQQQQDDDDDDKDDDKDVAADAGMEEPDDGSSPAESSDRLAELIKSANIASSPMSSLDSPQATEPLPAATKLLIKSTRIIGSDRKHTERCNICGFHFPDRKILILHKKLVHNIPEKDSSVSPDDLMKNYPCHLCTKVFKMRGSLMVHTRVAHPHNREGVDAPEQEADQLSSPSGENGCHSCPICRKAFKREQLVVQHMKIHDSKQFECDICGKMFTTKYFLKKHKRLHSGEMPYKCDLCDKSFTFQQSFHKHRLYHKDDKPHSCATCGRSFKELSTLHNHERIHTGEKPFVCESCGKCFRQRVSYLVHRRIHTGVMPYECKDCGRVFRYKVSQRTHKCTGQPSSESSPEESMDAERAEDDEAPQQPASSAMPPDKSEDSSSSSGFIQRLWSEHASGGADGIVQAIRNTELWSNQGDEACGGHRAREGERLLTGEFSTGLWGPAEATTTSQTTTADLYSMLENEMPSPSAEMEHLRLSPPVSNDDDGKDPDHFDDRNLSRQLHTINEESLKELLSSIP